jgi:predicted ATP-dependent endonuclease of OLD family
MPHALAVEDRERATLRQEILRGILVFTATLEHAQRPAIAYLSRKVSRKVRRKVSGTRSRTLRSSAAGLYSYLLNMVRLDLLTTRLPAGLVQVADEAEAKHT